MQRNVRLMTIHIKHDNGNARHNSGHGELKENERVHMAASKQDCMDAIEL